MHLQISRRDIRVQSTDEELVCLEFVHPGLVSRNSRFYIQLSSVQHKVVSQDFIRGLGCPKGHEAKATRAATGFPHDNAVGHFPELTKELVERLIRGVPIKTTDKKLFLGLLRSKKSIHQRHGFERPAGLRFQVFDLRVYFFFFITKKRQALPSDEGTTGTPPPVRRSSSRRPCSCLRHTTSPGP